MTNSFKYEVKIYYEDTLHQTFDAREYEDKIVNTLF